MDQPQPSPAPYPPQMTPPPAAAGIGAGKIIGAVVILAALVVGAYYLGRSKSDEVAASPSPSASSAPTAVACTTEAKICPDGSSVGRTGPACEFAPCPEPVSSVPAGWKTYTNTQYGFEVAIPNDWAVRDTSNSVLFLSPAELEAERTNSERAGYSIKFSPTAKTASGPTKTITLNGVAFTQYEAGQEIMELHFKTTLQGKTFDFSTLNESKITQVLATFKFTK